MHLGLPVWVDDPGFELDYHVRRSALPAPGTDAQLRELVGRLMSRQLDRARPLWEIYLVEGLSDDRFAIVTKIHHAMVDGLSSIDVGTVLLDVTPTPRESPPDDWHPAPEPSGLELAADAVQEQLLRPQLMFGTAQRALLDVQSVVRTGGAMLAAARSASRPAPANPLNAPIGRQRRYGTSAGPLDDYKAIRKEHGGTVNDVVLDRRHRGVAAVDDHPRGAGARHHDGAGDGAGERPRPQHGRASWATRSRRTSSTFPSASRTPSPGSRPSPRPWPGTRAAGRPSGPARWSGWSAWPRPRCTA